MSRATPKPEQLLDLLRRMEALSPTVEDDYRWLYGLAWTQNVGQGVKVRVSAPDPTGSVATAGDKMAARRACQHAYRLLEQSLSKLLAAASVLDDAFGEHGQPSVPYPYHRRVTSPELQASAAAQQRRRDRREGWGDS